MANFWWGQKAMERKVHWCSWDALCSSKFEGGTGLRDIESFNLSFLAKQGWRILLFPDSLLAQSLAARYFPRKDFFDAKIGYTPSYTWRSIMAARNILAEGVRWTVRNGQSIRIWRDKWLPSFPYTPQAPPREILETYQKVSDLLVDDGSHWDNIVVNSLFPSSIAKSILSIPICSTQQDDCLQWRYTKDGSFSVKTAYWSTKKLKDVLSSIPSSSTNNSSQWKWIWSLHIPFKFKIFLWRCMKNILPRKVNLRRRGMDIDASCSRCGVSPETHEHVVRDCRWASSFWQTCVLRLDTSSSSRPSSLQDWIFHLVHNQHQRFVEIFGALLWAAWKARNEIEFNRSTTSQVQFSSMALNLLHEFQALRGQLKIPKPPDVHDKWSPPPPNQVKINTDASLGLRGAAGIGGVCRDHEGKILKVFSAFLASCEDVELAEAIACRLGMQVAINLGYRVVIFESDNLNLASLLVKQDIPRSYIGSVVADILLLSRSLDLVSFCWTRRSCNAVANEIARLARNPLISIESVDSAPVTLRRIAAIDAASLS